jgi:hypothetical protein
LRDSANVRVRRKRIEKPGAQNVVKLVRVEHHRMKRQCPAASLILEIVECLIQDGAATLVGRLEVRNDDANIRQLLLGNGDKQVRQRRRCDVSKI